MQFAETPYFIKRAEGIVTLEELAALMLQIAANPEIGKLIPHGEGLRKVRMALGSRGKSGGARVIYYRIESDFTLLMDIYAKNQQENLTPAQIKALLRQI